MNKRGGIRRSPVHRHRPERQECAGPVVACVPTAAATAHDETSVPHERHGAVLPVVDEILEVLPLAMIAVDTHGQIVFANREAEGLFGYCRNELIGKSVEVLIPEELRSSHEQARSAYQRAPVTRRMGESRDLAARRRDGTTFPVAISLKALPTDEGHVTLAAVVDLSSQKALEANLREQYALMERRVAERTRDLERRNREMEDLLTSLEHARAELEQLSRHDPLTGLMNRREFDQRAANELRRALRRHSPTCIAMLDLDHFKLVNDRFGHTVGDRVLQRIAEILQANLRRDDVVARYGGEEFVVLLPETGLDESVAVIERVRSAVASEPWGELHEGLALTVSGGVAAHVENDTLEASIERADRSLYAAKRQGRDRVVAEPIAAARVPEP